VISSLAAAQQTRRRGQLEPALDWLRASVAKAPSEDTVGELADLLACHHRDLGLVDDLVQGLGWSREHYHGFDHLAGEPSLVDAAAAKAELSRVAAHPKLPNLRCLQIADDALDTGDRESAQRQHERAYPNTHPAERCYVRGRLAVARREPRTALLELRACIRLNPKLARAHQWVGRVLLGQRDGWRAAEHFDRALGLPLEHWYEPSGRTGRQRVVLEEYRGHDVLFAGTRWYARSVIERGDKLRVEDLDLIAFTKLVLRELRRRAKAALRPYLSTDVIRRGFPELADVVAEIETRTPNRNRAASAVPEEGS